jgi:hypothetical protein
MKEITIDGMEYIEDGTGLIYKKNRGTIIKESLAASEVIDCFAKLIDAKKITMSELNELCPETTVLNTKINAKVVQKGLIE